MPTYQYKAIDRTGKFKTGTFDAVNELDLETRVDKLGLDLVNYTEESNIKLSILAKKISRVDLINFCFYMEQLSYAGVSIIEGLGDLRGSLEHPRLKEVISGLITDIERGKSLSEAMQGYPKVFDTLFVSLIQAGEISGKMPEVFTSLTEMLKWQDELAKSTKKILMLPAIVGTVVIGVTLFLMMYLVPQLVGFMMGMGQELPFHTLALIAVSNFVQSYWYIVLGMPIVLIVFVKTIFVKSDSGRFLVDKAKLSIWKFGSIIEKIILSRYN